MGEGVQRRDVRARNTSLLSLRRRGGSPLSLSLPLRHERCAVSTPKHARHAGVRAGVAANAPSSMGASSSRPARALVTAALAGDAVEAAAVSVWGCCDGVCVGML